jgi:nucleotide-binding universal stress UspA family protein
LVKGRPVVVGVDGSAEAQRGLLFAADLSATLGSELVVVHAYGLVDLYRGSPPDVHARERQIDHLLQYEWCAPLADRTDVKWRCHCVQGSAVEGLLRAADDVDAGFIVVGSHGAGASSEPLLGSTSHHVVLNSHRPVIIVPPGDNHPHQRGAAGAMSNGVADA